MGNQILNSSETVLERFWNGSETEKSILNGLGKDKPYFW